MHKSYNFSKVRPLFLSFLYGCLLIFTYRNCENSILFLHVLSYEIEFVFSIFSC